MEDKLRAKAAVAEKLRLKNATLKQQYTKVEASLQQKEDMGEVLHVIDFDQLKIENQQYLEKIEDRNNELCARPHARAPPATRHPPSPATNAAVAPCEQHQPQRRGSVQQIELLAVMRRSPSGLVCRRLRLKLTTGNTVQVLNTLKHKLHNLTAESEWLKRETSTRKESLAKISEEITRVEQEKEQAARLDRKLRREENTESNMPQVLDYVQQKAEQYELERSLNAWRRKVEIADMENKRYASIARKGGLI
jgi:hypothetical protein